MVICLTLAVLFGIFFFIRHHTGPAHLAMIAGLSVHATFGTDFTNFVMHNFPNFQQEMVSNIIYLVLAVGFPILLYLNSSHGGMSGVLRVVEAAICAILMTVLVAPMLGQYCGFDPLASDISSWLLSIEGPVLLVGVLMAYFDIIVYHEA